MTFSGCKETEKESENINELLRNSVWQCSTPKKKRNKTREERVEHREARKHKLKTNSMNVAKQSSLFFFFHFKPECQHQLYERRWKKQQNVQHLLMSKMCAEFSQSIRCCCYLLPAYHHIPVRFLVCESLSPSCYVHECQLTCPVFPIAIYFRLSSAM